MKKQRDKKRMMKIRWIHYKELKRWHEVKLVYFEKKRKDEREKRNK